MKFNFFRNFLAAIAIWTMIFSPVAFGLQSKAQFDRVTQDQIKSMLVDLGLNKKTTYAQFWDRTKHLYPAQVYSDVEAYFKAQPSTVMPAFDVTYTQSAKGEKIPTIKITERGQTYNVEIIGELNEWARVNQVSLSESDLTRLKPAIEKLSPGSTKLEVYRKDFARFEGFPRMTPQAWRTMKPEERAAYIVKMRLLWFEARRVIEANEPEARVTPNQKKPKKTSSFEEFIKLMIGEEAFAQGQAADRTARNAKWKGQPAKSERLLSAAALSDKENVGMPCLKGPKDEKGGGCIVAGEVAPENGYYALTWNSTSAKTGKLSCGCSHESVSFQNLKRSIDQGIEGDMIGKFSERDQLNSLCKENKDPSLSNFGGGKGEWIACKPEIYSFRSSDGSPYCVHSMSQAFQYATTFNGQPANQTPQNEKKMQSCDQQSQLNTSPYDVKNPGTPNIAQTEAEQEKENYRLTKEFLNGMLKAKQNGLSIDAILDTKFDDPKKIAEVDQFLLDTQKAFEKEIREGILLCSKAKNSIDKNFEPACSQLHRRWLFTEKYLSQFRQKSCDPNSKYIGLYETGEKISDSKKIDFKGAQISKTDLNKKTLADLTGQPVCKCNDREGKLIPMGQLCSAGSVTTSVCPKGSTPAPEGYGFAMTSDERERKETCVCDSNKKQFPGYEDKDKTNEEFKKACTPAAVISPPPPPPPRDEKRDCNAEFPQASPVDENCICTAGSRKDKIPVQVNSAPAEDPAIGASTSAENKWTCDEKVSLWPLIPFGLLALLMFKKKKDNPPTCTGLNQIMKLGFCVCKFSDPAICPAGAKSDCSGCAAVPTCSPPQSSGKPPLCYCPNRDTCVGKNVLLQPTTCVCEPVEGGTTPDQCVGSDCSGGTPPLTPTGR